MPLNFAFSRTVKQLFSYRQRRAQVTASITGSSVFLLSVLFSPSITTLLGRHVRVPGKEVCLAHVINPSQSCIYQNLGLHIGVHEGEDHTGEAIGMIRFTPWEAVVVAADIAVKSANVEIGFMDRFSGSLILTGGLTEVQTAVEEVVKFFREVLGFKTCAVHKS